MSKILNIEKLVVHFDSFASLQLTTSQNSKISLRFCTRLSSKSLEKLSSAKYFLSPGVVVFLSLSQVKHVIVKQLLNTFCCRF